MQKKLLTNNKSNLDAAQLMPASKLKKTRRHLIDKVALCVKQDKSIFLYLLIVKLDTILHLRGL